MSEKTQFKVVINHEEQYNIIPSSDNIPKGFEAAGKIGTKEECLAYVKSVWTKATPKDWQKLVNSLK
ncbi:MAG TPA: MbtH family NRPS accessory protein [Anaerolineales bacterium]|nr:MbtH family NRPS accessory protein [Anaerolineales bacterium]